MQIVVVEGSSVVDIDAKYGHTTVFILDYLEPECGMHFFMCTIFSLVLVLLFTYLRAIICTENERTQF